MKRKKHHSWQSAGGKVAGMLGCWRRERGLGLSLSLEAHCEREGRQELVPALLRSMWMICLG